MSEAPITSAGPPRGALGAVRCSSYKVRFGGHPAAAGSSQEEGEDEDEDGRGCVELEEASSNLTAAFSLSSSAGACVHTAQTPLPPPLLLLLLLLNHHSVFHAGHDLCTCA